MREEFGVFGDTVRLARGGWLQGLYARHRLDLSVADVAFGLLACVWQGRGAEVESGIESEIVRLCSLGDEGLICSSVRSGWDLWLAALGLQPGDEVLVSAVTHPDMVRIIQGHGLLAVPVDLDPETLSPRPEALQEAVTGRTRVVLVAHLFGAMMDLDRVGRFAREHDLLLAEDCAQAFQGTECLGHPAADASMYSFGTLKTSTALGGAVLRVRNEEVITRMRGIRADYPAQGRRAYAGKLVKVLCLVAASRPRPYGLLARACQRLSLDFDALLNSVVRALPAGEPVEALFRRIRLRPSVPLLALLARRLETFDGARLGRRAAAGERVARGLRGDVVHPGVRSSRRTHWLFPIVVSDPAAVVRELRLRGLDASRATSSIAVTEAPAGCAEPSDAARMMSGVVFLPAYPGLPEEALDRMVGIVNELGAREARELYDRERA
ncbi:MAG: aminotransferase class V-fold PLP-dependent enzyme [Rubrobacter sp.]